MSQKRRIGFHEVITTTREMMKQAVVELENGYVTTYFKFEGELPMTEWLGGRAELRYDSDGGLYVFLHGKRLF